MFINLFNNVFAKADKVNLTIAYFFNGALRNSPLQYFFKSVCFNNRKTNTVFFVCF